MMRLGQDFLRGSYTPVITPFRNGKVDFESFAALVERQIQGGSHGIVVAGTTGEPSSLTLDERCDLIRAAVETVAKRIPVVAGTGSQSFAETVEITERAESSGVDAVLVVTPYYVRPPQRGLVQYFISVAKRTQLPFLIYHIPARASVSVNADTVFAIAEQSPNLVGIKHASSDLEFVTEVLARLGSEFRIFCGLEALSLPMMTLGAAGTMNAVGNLDPARVAALCNAVLQGDLDAGRKLHFELFPLNQAIFLDTNPIPLKYMMSRIGLLDSPELRLPLMPFQADQRQKLDLVLSRAGLLSQKREEVTPTV